ncbi:sensor histidine kinase [Sporomusa acidovorans]|uniref:histidine kinase n=1 Tax=Sporomusa acidovorans (strain ATCC 49682 / DSM 3132 / Mol) TaxID=1123286 RepID=A0ABZ3J7Z5_SPOA4|nr:PAS domain-containing sensor histidine kinase [Sporomusa acidovorans]OZC17521.1 putative sensor histidine kinase pdtaS [Sporomusa acidovorans DSM 3132]SDF08288.1 Two-component sensor histidine kinase, contains HisKA and HATPase domains [Sporomusa acidovorans]
MEKKDDLQTFRKLCREYTDLDTNEAGDIEDVIRQLPVFAELTGTDVFIDAFLKNGVDAIVLAWAHPPGHSLYKQSVVGEIAYATKEPAVFQAFSREGIVRNVRGLSQEGVPIDQTVVPLYSKTKRVIGVIIMEKDISAEIRHEEQVEFLNQTAERLSSTLMSLTFTGFAWDEWVGNGIFVLNQKGEIIYANKNAARIGKAYFPDSPLGENLMQALAFKSMQDMLGSLSSPMEYEVNNSHFLFRVHPLVNYMELSGCVVSIQDVTELRQKERQLDVQSTIIREIHHRVKNNLQNVVSLLNLQKRRVGSKVVEQEFEACVSRIISIARVHDVFAHQSWNSLNILDLAGYLVESLVDNYTLADQNIKISVQGQKVRIPDSQAVPVALVLNELITNSLKHGIKEVMNGEISIFVEESEGIVHIMVADTENQETDRKLNIKNEGLGLYLVNLLACEQMEGTFKIERRDSTTIAKVSFPSCRKEKDDDSIVDTNRRR